MTKQFILIVNVNTERVIIVLAYFRLGLFTSGFQLLKPLIYNYSGERVQQFGEHSPSESIRKNCCFDLDSGELVGLDFAKEN